MDQELTNFKSIVEELYNLKSNSPEESITNFRIIEAVVAEFEADRRTDEEWLDVMEFLYMLKAKCYLKQIEHKIDELKAVMS